MEIVAPESSLYPLVLQWLRSDFRHSILAAGLGEHLQTFSADVSTKSGDAQGLWSRPDLATIVFSRGKFVPTWHTALFSFEVKTASGIGEAAVYEAFSHTRFAHYSVLVWQASENCSKSAAITQLCEEYGIGAVTTEAPNVSNSYIVRAAPARTDVNLFAVDRFIEQRFGKHERQSIASWLRANGWTSSIEVENSL